MVELHSHFTVEGFRSLPGSRFTIDGLFPTNHAEHETVEITPGGHLMVRGRLLYLHQLSEQLQYQWVGDHIRLPRPGALEGWHLPAGFSISNQIGYQRTRLFPSSPMPGLGRSVPSSTSRLAATVCRSTSPSIAHGTVPASRTASSFPPNIKVGYDLTRKINAGVEYCIFPQQV
jgi:hypothetical protein